MLHDNNITSESDLESIISAQERQPKRRRTSTGPKYFCSIEGCQAVFKRLDHLDRHEFKHTGIKKHSCTYEGCDKSYTIVTHLKRHIRCTHERKATSERSVPCDIETCDKMFRSVSNMQRHIRDVHENPKIYICVHCGEKFTQRLKMRRHEINKHTKEYPFNCSKCKRGFHQEYQYERHECKIYPCSNCSLTFEKWSAYIKHCKETQHGRKYYKCEHCGQAYGKPGELQKHVANKHLDDKLKIVFKCTYKGCTRSYAYERNLKHHQRMKHSDDHFKCVASQECKRVFSSAQNLQKHLKRDHYEKRVATKCSERLKERRKRKDAGQPVQSNLSKLSGIVVNKDLDRLLRVRDETALDKVTATLGELQSKSGDVESTTDTEVAEEVQAGNVKEGRAIEKNMQNSDNVTHSIEVNTDPPNHTAETGKDGHSDGSETNEEQLEVGESEVNILFNKALRMVAELYAKELDE